LCGSLASITWHPFVVSAGASGAVFGVYGVLAAYLVRHRGSIPRPVLVQLQKSTVFFIGFNLLFGLQQKGIDMAAHTGGLLGGFAVALIVARPLMTPPAASTAWRDLVVAALGVALFAGAVLFLPRAADVQRELSNFQAVERGVVDAYNGALEGRRANRLSDVDLANIIDRQVLPPWRQARQRLSTLGHLPPQEAQRLDDIGRYMALREQGWAAFSQALRTGDDAKAGESKALQQRADALLKATNKGSD
jgi:rhomboid protease GluP